MFVFGGQMSFNIMINNHSQCYRIYRRNNFAFLFNFSPGNKALKIWEGKGSSLSTHFQTLNTKQALDITNQPRRSTRIRNVGCPNSSRDRLKSFKQVVPATLLNALSWSLWTNPHAMIMGSCNEHGCRI